MNLLNAIKNFRIKILLVVLISISIFYILPYLVVTQYTFLTTDDFCLTNSSFYLYFEKISSWYMNHNGRYANALFGRLPVYDLIVYRLVLLILFMFFGFSLYKFSKAILYFFNIEIKITYRIFLWLIIFVSVIGLLPSLFEFFYWYSSTSSYLISSSLFLLLSNFLMKIYKGIKINILFSCIIVFLLVGSNELFIPISNLLLLLFLIRSIIYKTDLFPVISLNIIGWIGSLMVIFSPGTFSRRQYFPDGGNLTFSIISSIETAFQFLVFQIVNFPFIFFYSGIFLGVMHLMHKRRGLNMSFVNPFYLALISFILFASVIFVPFYAQGYLEVYKERIGNIVHIIFLILFLFNLINLSAYFSSIIYLKRKSLIMLAGYSFLIFLILLPFTNKNYRLMAGDLKNNRFEIYKNDMNTRIEKIKQFEGTNLFLDKINGTQILKKYELSTDPDFWVNQCYLVYLKSKYSNDAQSVQLKQHLKD